MVCAGRAGRRGARREIVARPGRPGQGEAVDGGRKCRQYPAAPAETPWDAAAWVEIPRSLFTVRCLLYYSPMLYPDPEEALRDLRGAALESAYRAWAKRLHPDGPDGNHEAFLRLRKAYEEAKAGGRSAPSAAPRSSTNKAQARGPDEPRREPPADAARSSASVRPSVGRRIPTDPDAFDPWQAVRETGRTGPLPPEDCLFAALERWRQAGSPTAKPVSSASTGARNRRILRSVLHWASLVDPALARDFALLVRFDAGPLRTTAASRAERDARRKLEAGLDGLLRWREEGRDVTAELARERLEAAKELVELHGLPRPEIVRIAEWMAGRLTVDSGRK